MVEAEAEEEIVEVPIEVAQEYVTGLVGFAPLQLSDDLWTEYIAEEVGGLHVQTEGQAAGPSKCSFQQAGCEFAVEILLASC
ncbi:unnamed protein product [Dibothriocephalus latus]|uniref:Uncharacterized protein n=1 Tax=Dibothriocephalus latus TaxID=60516 RepID=A0A3P7LR60_DIBLA|nr:unnamed protein product [Dibothriocephalus latus]